MYTCQAIWASMGSIRYPFLSIPCLYAFPTGLDQTGLSVRLTVLHNKSGNQESMDGYPRGSNLHRLYQVVLGMLAVVLSTAVLGFSSGIRSGVANQPARDNRELTDSIRVEACLALDVQDREPLWRSDVFEETVGKVFCWTRVIGVKDSTMITHIWMHDTTIMARVPLKVGSPSWRTWSFKTIPQWARGDWKVRLEDANGMVFDSVCFEVLTEAEMWNAPIVPPGYTGRRRAAETRSDQQ